MFQGNYYLYCKYKIFRLNPNPKFHNYVFRGSWSSGLEADRAGPDSSGPGPVQEMF